MVRFEELQQLWQNQPAPAAAPSSVDARGMSETLRRFAKRQNILNSLKVLLVVWQTWFCLSKLGVNALTVVGQALFVAGVASILLTDWRNQLDIARMDFTRPSAGFVDAVLARLADPNLPFRRKSWLNFWLILGGINLSFGTRWTSLSMRDRLLDHLGLTVFPVIAFYLGLKLRAKRYEIEYRPIKERLLTMKQALEEQPQ